MPAWLAAPAKRPGARGSVERKKGKKDQDALVNSTAKMQVGLERRAAALEATVYLAFFVAEGQDALGNACAAGNEARDGASKATKERRKGGDNIDWKARGTPIVALFAVIIQRAIGLLAPNGKSPRELGYKTMMEVWQTPQMLGLFVLQCRYKKARQPKDGEAIETDPKGVLSVAFNVQDFEAARTLWPIFVGYLTKVEMCAQIPGPARRRPTERWIGTHTK